jgi:hypothetical protein
MVRDQKRIWLRWWRRGVSKGRLIENSISKRRAWHLTCDARLMHKKSFIWVSLIVVCLPVVSVAQHSPIAQRPSVNVSTQRSDGAIFPAVAQTQRQQKQRRVRVSGSIQALPNSNSRTPVHEPARGGDFVAPASETVGNNAFDIYPHAFVTGNVAKNPRKPEQKP